MRKTPKTLKANISRLAKLVQDFGLAHGGVRHKEWSDEVRMPSIYGDLLISVSTISLTVFCRFVEPERAAGKLGVTGPNPVTGKWNLHGGTVDEGETADTVFERLVKRVRTVDQKLARTYLTPLN